MFHLDGFKSEPFSINNRVKQGCSESLLWFLFSNTDLIDNSRFGKDDIGTAYIGNTYYTARVKTTEQSNAMLVKIIEWARTLHAYFELDKTH